MAIPVLENQGEHAATGYPVAAELSSLLPGGRLRPGTSVTVGGDIPLLLALAAQAAAAAESWAVIGLPQLNVLAAEAMGLNAGTGMFVDQPGRRWAEALAMAAEAVPVLLLGPLGPAPGPLGRRLAAVLRRTGAVLLTTGAWDGAQLRLAVSDVRWEGVGDGHGLLRARQATVTATGRGAAGGAARTARLWLPGPSGRPAPLTDADADGGDDVLSEQSAVHSARGTLHAVR